MVVKRLRQQCSSRGIKYCHKMPKTKMIEMLLKNDDDPKIKDDLETKIKCNRYQTKWVSNNRVFYSEYQKQYHKEWYNSRVKKSD